MKKIIKFCFLCFFILINFSSIVLSEEIESISVGLTIGKSHSKDFPTSAMVKNVEIDSPADKAGIKKGDLISSVNKKKIKNPVQYIKIIKSFYFFFVIFFE